jgi:hypothetical protein
MSLSEEDLWYLLTTGFHRVSGTLPLELVHRLNGVTDTQIEQLVEPVIWENDDERTPAGVDRKSVV